MKHSDANQYERVRQSVLAPYSHLLDATEPGFFCVVYDAELSPEVKDALKASAVQLGYSSEALCTVKIDPELTKDELLTIIEAIDPLCLVACNSSVVDALSMAYNRKIAPDSFDRLLERPCALFDDIASLITTDKGKAQAWGLLKQLPRC